MKNLFGFTTEESGLYHSEPEINPSTGLPMVGSIDVEGNPFGTDIHTSADMDFLDSSDSFTRFGDDNFNNDF